MNLIKLEAENVFSLGKVSLDLADRGLLLIIGFSNDDNNGNGAGKSSLANHSIIWGLYGQTYDGSKGDSVINRNSATQSSSVAITFSGMDDRIYKIIRTRNPNKLRLLSFDDRDISHKLEKETQETINHLLGRDFATFIHSDLIGPGTERSFFKLSGAEQVSIIESLLPMTKLEEWAQSSKNKAKTLREELEIKKKEISIVQGKKELLETQLKDVANENLRWRANTTSELYSTKSALKRVENEKKSKEAQLEAIKNEMIEIRRKIPITVLANENAEKTKENLRDTKIKLEATIPGLLRLANAGVCNTCGQSTPESSKAEALQKLKETKAELIKFDAEYLELSAGLAKVFQLENLQKRINGISSTSHDELIGVYKKKIEECENAASPYETSINAMVQSIKNFESETQSIKADLSIWETDLKWMEFWAKGFSTDLRTMIIEEVCPFLEGRINDYLVKLRNPQFKATVSTIKSLKSGDIREKFNLQVRSIHGADSFELLSVGEKQLVSFAASLAVADLASTQVQGKSYILILDEPFMGLSGSNCDNVVNFLNSYDRSTILLISNEENIKTQLPNQIRVVKTKGVTWLE